MNNVPGFVWGFIFAILVVVLVLLVSKNGAF